jgi:hypothetical protein
MKNYDIEIKQVENGLYLTTKFQGVKYGQHYPHKDITQAIKDFEALILKYLTKGDLAVMGGW